MNSGYVSYTFASDNEIFFHFGSAGEPQQTLKVAVAQIESVNQQVSWLLDDDNHTLNEVIGMKFGINPHEWNACYTYDGKQCVPYHYIRTLHCMNKNEVNEQWEDLFIEGFEPVHRDQLARKKKRIASYFLTFEQVKEIQMFPDMNNVWSVTDTHISIDGRITTTLYPGVIQGAKAYLVTKRHYSDLSTYKTELHLIERKSQ